jgi:hypothetical protein
MDELEWQKRLRQGIGGSKLWSLRQRTATRTARDFVDIGTSMSQPAKSNAGSQAAIQAIGLLLQMAGELALAAARLLSSREHYAGAALLRQIVEIEYLTWTFKEKHRDADAWLKSTREVRMKFFGPSQLRQTSKGRFLDKDYQNHCEEGGHPTARGNLLLGGKNVQVAQLLLADLILHSWRTWDQVVSWSKEFPYASRAVVTGGSRISIRLNEWGKRDPLYSLAVEQYPDK